MTTNRTATEFLDTCKRRLLFVCCAWFTGQLLPESRGADDTPDPFERLYNVIMVRKDADGKSYGSNEVGLLIYGRSDFPFDQKTFPRLKAALTRFHSLSDDKIKSYGKVKRALLQRHLWTVFDATFLRGDNSATQLAHRRDLREILARLIRRVAMTRDEIMSLPDTRAATIKNGGYPNQHDPKDRFKPFLPKDLYSRETSWVCMGKVDYYDSDHAAIDRWRSAFFQFVRLPGGLKVTQEYVKKLNAREAFPVGTQFALVEQPFLISDKNEMVLSPLINTIQLRAYLNVTQSSLQVRPKAITCVAEFVIQPRKLMKGESVMRALSPDEIRYQTASSGSGGLVDPFKDATVASIRERIPTLQQCINCHERSRSGIRSLGDFMFGDRAVDRLTFEIGTPSRIAEGVATIKQKTESWKKLQKLWQKE